MIIMIMNNKGSWRKLGQVIFFVYNCIDLLVTQLE